MRKVNSISRSSLFFRFFSWAWGIEKDEIFCISFCRLFWGTMFLPLAVVGYYISWFAMITIAASAILVCFNHGIWGVILFLVGWFFADDHFNEVARKSPEQRRQEKQEALARAEAAVHDPDLQIPAIIWFVDYVLVPVRNLFFRVMYTKPGQLCLDVKRTLCPIFYVKR